MRETYAESQIPAAVDSPVYLDAQQIARGLMGRNVEGFIGQVVGAGGAGGDLLNVPFEPAVIIALEPTGPTGTLMIRGMSVADVKVNLITLAAATVFPSVTKVGANDYTVSCPTALAPDGDTATLICFGVRNPGTGL